MRETLVLVKTCILASLKTFHQLIMIHLSAFCRSLCLITAMAAPAFAYPELESFEKNAPRYLKLSGGSTEISKDKAIDGSKSLKWNFENGDSLVFKTGPLGNVNVWTGYGGYSRSSLTLPICFESLDEGLLLVEILAGNKVAGTIEVPAAHVGWQQLVYHYSYRSKIKWVNPKLRDKLDALRITAKGFQKPSSVFLDAIKFNHPRDFRDARECIKEPWFPAEHDFRQRPAPSAKDLAKLDALHRSIVPKENPKISKKSWQKQLDQIRTTIAEKGYHKGKGIKGNLGPIFGFINSVANKWAVCADPALKAQFAAEFLQVNDWLQEQGLVVNGAAGRANNYVGRTYVDAATLMQGPLKDHGTLEKTLNYLKWAYSYDEQVFSDNYQKSMDYFHNEAFRLLRIALTHADPTVRWHHVSQFRISLSKQLVQSVKPDGSIYHHGFHYFAYGNMGINSISGVLRALSDAGLPIDRAGADTVKLALKQMRWYSGSTILWSLHGRNASGTSGIPSGAFLNLGKAYSSYRNGKWDADLVNAYLRYQPGQANKPEFAKFRPEASPSGFNTMPYAALGMHRRDDWLAGIKGVSKYAAAGESYANANRHGIFMSHGQLELLTHPAPLPSIHGSGTRPNLGYDWCAIEGATTVHAPLAKLANGNGTRIPRSSQGFVGGLSHRGRNGVFVQKFDESYLANIARKKGQKGGNFQALKSWFTFDNRIICLGSDITLDQSTYPIRTNLFQKFLTPDHAITIANAQPLALGEKGTHHKLSSETNQLVDPYGNAYFTPDPVTLRISEQTSRDCNDKNDTKGNYSTAWIDHGINPTQASYEYAILVQPELDQITRPNYQVLHRNSKAHVVKDALTNSTGYVIFDSAFRPAETETLRSVNQACLVMIEEKPDGITISLVDPDLHLDQPGPRTLSLTLRGSYRLNGTLLPTNKDGDSLLSVTCENAVSQTLELTNG